MYIERRAATRLRRRTTVVVAAIVRRVSMNLHWLSASLVDGSAVARIARMRDQLTAINQRHGN